MPPKRTAQLQPPVPSSEDEDQGSESDRGSESKSGSEELNSNIRAKNPPAPTDDDDDDGEDSGSGSDGSESESESGSHTPDPVKSGAGGVKRPAENEPKRAKKKLVLSEGEGEEDNGAKKRPLFQRLWSEDDEIVVLKGIRDYVAQYGIDSLNDMKAFFDFIKNSLHVDASRNQLKDKVHRLKKKFLNNLSKEKEKGGKDRFFSKPHEQKIYEVSKLIWAPDGKLLGRDTSKVNNNGSASRRVGKSGAEEQSGPRRNVAFGRGVGVAALEHEILTDGLEYIDRRKRVELEDKWRTLWVEECQLYLKKVELIQEQTTLVLEAIKAGEEEED